ncbi:MAG: exodeoxyribonuclease VII large subunit, partial [Clostridia bacterium]|nr:exodeoxyribonuclease VII large subunit [Clostridia bacterium]
ICDFVADKRAPTPSAAAELAVPETHELMRKIDNIIGRMSLLLSKRIESSRQVLDFYRTQGVFAHPERMFEERKMRLLLLGQRLEGSITRKVTEERHRLSERTAKLEALSPLSILSRGYSVASGESGKVISSVEDATVGEHFSLRVKDGSIRATVDNVCRNGE